MSEGHLGHPNPEWENDGSPLYGAGWADAREYVRNRDEVCQHCGGDGSEYDLEVHHLVPVRLFRVWDRPDVSDAHAHRNLVLLCQRCHVKAEHGLIDVERVERPL
nr:HNH endonuclease signature motif containing protein [Halarchaeum rubridurum]